MAQQPHAATRASMKQLLWVLTFALVVIVSLGSVMLLFIGMLPTLVAFLVDRTPKRYSTFCVGGLNFSGVFPSLLDLWTGTNEVSAAIDIMIDPFRLTVMYGAAAFGWMLFMVVPPVVGAFLAVSAQRKVAQLRTAQRELIAEWGPEIAARGTMRGAADGDK
jgi:hypothetical protein